MPNNFNSKRKEMEREEMVPKKKARMVSLEDSQEGQRPLSPIADSTTKGPEESQKTFFLKLPEELPIAGMVSWKVDAKPCNKSIDRRRNADSGLDDDDSGLQWRSAFDRRAGVWSAEWKFLQRSASSAGASAGSGGWATPSSGTSQCRGSSGSSTLRHAASARSTAAPPTASPSMKSGMGETDESTSGLNISLVVTMGNSHTLSNAHRSCQK